MIDNQGFSANDLNKIPTGTDVPDVNRDKAGFDGFKARYFPDLAPIVPGQGSTTITPSTRGQIQVIPNGPQGLASDGECPASPAVLTIGSQASIAGKDLNLRPRPNVDTDPITIIPNFALVSVVDGPRCRQEVRWFMVEYKGVQGWAAEVGTGGEYHMYPVVVIEPEVPVVVPTSTSITQVVPTNTQQPLVEAPVDPNVSGEPFFCSWWIIGWVACDLAEANSANARCDPQCMTEMRKGDFRPDMNLWSPGTGSSDPNEVLVNAENMPIYTVSATEQKMQVRVREPGESPEDGDLIIWPNDCGGANASTGHIGQVKTVISVMIVDIHDSNWDNTCTPKDRQIQILPCMRFVTMPFPAGTYVPAVQKPPVINCDDYLGWQNFACNYIPWWKP